MTKTWLSAVVVVILAWPPEWAGAGGVEEVEIAGVVTVGSLSGVVQDYQRLEGEQGDVLPGVVVQECTKGWKSVVRSTRTDEAGQFALPAKADGKLHYLRLSRHGWNDLVVRVRVSPKSSERLVLRLQIST